MERRACGTDVDPTNLTTQSQHSQPPRSRSTCSLSEKGSEKSYSTCSLSEKGSENVSPVLASSSTRPVGSILKWISKATTEDFKALRPSYAFPSPYSPSCNDSLSPFPTLSDYKWIRKHSSSSNKTEYIHVDMESFESSFRCQLCVSEKDDPKPSKRKRSNEDLTVQWQDPTLADLRPRKRIVVRTSNLPNGSYFSGMQSCSVRPDSISSTTPTTCSTFSKSPTTSLSPHHQSLSWQSSKFVEWSSIPNLGLNCSSSNLPFQTGGSSSP